MTPEQTAHDLHRELLDWMGWKYEPRTPQVAGIDFEDMHPWVAPDGNRHMASQLPPLDHNLVAQARERMTEERFKSYRRNLIEGKTDCVDSMITFALLLATPTQHAAAILRAVKEGA